MKLFPFRKYFLAFSLILLIAVSVKAQTVTWDSTYRPGKYVELAKKFKDDLKSKKGYCFFRQQHHGWNRLVKASGFTTG